MDTGPTSQWQVDKLYPAVPVVVRPVTVRFGVVELSLAGAEIRVMFEVPETVLPSSSGRIVLVAFGLLPASKAGISASASAVVF